MNFREAYATLILGRLSQNYSSDWEKIRHYALWEDYSSPVEKYGVTREDAEQLRRAARVKAQIRPSYINGIRTYESIFELMLFEEGTLLFGGWQHHDNSFRGHRDANWVLSPNLARAPANAKSNIENTLAMTRLLLMDESPIKHLPAIKLLGVLQHYGFLTPLLDFSTDLRVAAAFACRGYRRNLGPSMGCIIQAHNVDFQKLARVTGTALGERVSFKVDEVDRIRNQKGIFFADFKVGFLETFTSVERCYFKHGQDTELFGVTVGLTEEVLFPPNDSIFQYVEASRKSLEAPTNMIVPASRAAVFEEVKLLLCHGYGTSVSSSEVGDYLQLAKTWTDWDTLSVRKRQEIEIFSRWFGMLKEAEGLDLPPTCLTLTRLQHAVESIVAFDDRAEDATDIFARLAMRGKKTMEPVLRQMFREVRAEVSAKKIISRKIIAGHSSFLLAPEDSVAQTADYLCDLVRDAGLNLICLSSRDVNANLNLVPLETLSSVIVLLLHSVPDARTALFCKHIADDFRMNRVGLRFPSGQVAENRLMIHCGWVVTTPNVLREWGRDFYEIADYFSVIDLTSDRL